jgi:alkylation response protein AidB-like acyl-CoA dehydrogenase
MDAVIAIEQVAAACPRSADVIQSGNFGALRVLAEFGSPDQKERYLRPLLRGEALICVAMTEPNAGSAMTDLTTSATPDGDGFRINGSKIFTTHSTHATFFLVYVRFGPGVGGIGSVLINRSAEGLSFGASARFLGGEEWNPLFFDNVYVSSDDVLLGPGGFKEQMSGFNVERLGNSARSLALGRYAYELAREHALTRSQFGRPLAEFQGLQWKFADMKIKLDAAQLLLYRAAVEADSGFPSPESTAIAKVMCNRSGFEVANESLQIMGGTGYSDEVLVEYCLRRTRGWMIAGGTIEMLLNRIAESIFERRFSQRPPR